MIQSELTLCSGLEKRKKGNFPFSKRQKRKFSFSKKKKKENFNFFKKERKKRGVFIKKEKEIFFKGFKDFRKLKSLRYSLDVYADR